MELVFNLNNEKFPLKRLLGFTGYTQQAFAEQFGVSQPTVSRLCAQEKLEPKYYLLFLQCLYDEFCTILFEDNDLTIELTERIKLTVNQMYGKKAVTNGAKEEN